MIDSITVLAGNRETSIDMLTFPGGEPHIKSDFIYPVVDVDARLATAEGMMTLMVLSDFLRRRSGGLGTLFLPYVPGARQDRDAPLTAKVYADMINSCGFERVFGVDVHSDVSAALIDNFHNIELRSVFPTVGMPRPEEAVLVCPDAGAAKRVEGLAAKSGHQVVYARKHRDMATGSLSGFSCDPIPDGMQAIVVDDICDGGGTFLGLASVIDLPKEMLHLWTTHGIYSKGLRALQDAFGSIGCTDSFPISHGGTYHRGTPMTGGPADVYVTTIRRGLWRR